MCLCMWLRAYSGLRASGLHRLQGLGHRALALAVPGGVVRIRNCNFRVCQWVLYDRIPKTPRLKANPQTRKPNLIPRPYPNPNPAGTTPLRHTRRK